MIEDQSSFRRLVSELRRHWRWGREQGLGRLIEEDELHPLAHLRRSLSSWQWRRNHPVPAGSARAVFLLGVQRSGTNMIVRGIETCPEVEVHNENDRRAFERYRLRSNDVIRSIVETSRHRIVLFKPLCDSHRAPQLLDDLQLSVQPRAIWAYRSVDGRVRSAVAKFGDANRRVLAEIATGAGLHRWQAQGLTTGLRELIQSYDYSTLSPESASALFWYVRNSLFFELGLDTRRDVLLTSYDDFISAPHVADLQLREFLGVSSEGIVTDMVDRSRHPDRQSAVEIEPSIRRLCDDLHARVELVLRRAGQARG